MHIHESISRKVSKRKPNKMNAHIWGPNNDIESSFLFWKKSINTSCFILPLNEFFKLHKISPVLSRSDLYHHIIHGDFQAEYRQNKLTQSTWRKWQHSRIKFETSYSLKLLTTWRCCRQRIRLHSRCGVEAGVLGTNVFLTETYSSLVIFHYGLSFCHSWCLKIILPEMH